jgi:hypothetical protein
MPNGKPPRTILRFSGMAFSMAAAIGGGVWAGRWADARTDLEFPVFTVLGALFGTAAALYHTIRTLSK